MKAVTGGTELTGGSGRSTQPVPLVDQPTGGTPPVAEPTLVQVPVQPPVARLVNVPSVRVAYPGFFPVVTPAALTAVSLPAAAR